MNKHFHFLNIKTEEAFINLALETFINQYVNNSIYQNFCKLLKVKPQQVNSIEKIPFLPVEFFKSHTIKTGNFIEEIVFSSSGTTGQINSKHYVKNIDAYVQNFLHSFKHFYGNISNYCVLALLPSYLEREGSSLVFMANALIKESKHQKSGFYLHNLVDLVEQLKTLEKANQPTLLLGVSFALLDLAENHQLQLKNTIVMETGGMKGKRKELTRAELHQILTSKLGVNTIHAEYGMTELLSQAYSKGNGIFTTPSWMRVLIRDINDPFSYLPHQKTGGINIIDLANTDSCAFIATQDLGKLHPNNQFEVLGRFDNSDLRGCNLLVE